jgi:cobalt-zinc-cadmium efflux system membrane fusion protein
MGRGRLAVLVLVGAPICTSSRTPTLAVSPPGEAWLTPEEMAQAHVVIAAVEERDIDEVLVSGGRVAFHEERVAHVLSPVDGQVVHIEGQLGQHVARGQALAVVSSPDLGLATAEASKARAALVQATHAYARERGLGVGVGTSASALERAEDAYRTAKAERDRAAQKAKLLHGGQRVTQLYPVVSPIDGEVLARDVSPGLEVRGTYAGGAGPELYTVGDLEEVWLYADVHEGDLGRVRVGEIVAVDPIGDGPPLAGVVDWISGMLDPQTRTASLRCTIRNPAERLKPGMLVTVRIRAVPAHALAVERSAIFSVAGYDFALVARGASADGRERFVRMPVEVDSSLPGPWLPLKRGLAQGERVVVAGVAAIAAKL